MPKHFIKNMLVNDDALKTLAYRSTKNADEEVEDEWYKSLSDKDYMRIAVFLAEKSYKEGGCPIGAVVKDNETGKILGKGHNRLIQDNDPLSHGETVAIRDAGRIDFSKTTLYTTLRPCDWCQSAILKLEFNRVVIGDIGDGNETGSNLLRSKGVVVDVLEDEKGKAIYDKYQAENPKQDLEDWRGLAAVRRTRR